MADINLPECCEKVLGLGAAEIREEREKGQISQMEFLLVFTSKKKKKSLRCLVLGPQKHVHLFFIFLTCALD